MKIITGGAGFIGSCIVAKLNELGYDDLIVVDHLEDHLLPDVSTDPKVHNLTEKKYIKFYDKTDFLDLIAGNKLDVNISAIIHMGACSSTTVQDAKYFQENNLEYTRTLSNWALKNEIRFIYASSAATYGDGSVGYKDDDDTVRKCKPLNLYGQSKQDFDISALENHYLDRMVGLKFFNVFGPNEYHKADMRSVVNKAYKRVAEEGKMSLFKSYHPDFGDGEQKRDFIYVKDAVDVVMYFLDHPEVNGIFNVGTGQARSWNDLAQALFKAVGKKPHIEYIPMPEILKDKYQYFTQADMTKLKKSGYTKPFTSLEAAVEDYVSYLKNHRYW
ncbi:MAG: ADP-glyceromanno-heptose 6-epimerase [Candidatus Omnitrophica bacterium]|nr:ADP-glyceromanno-heptose 6-epimerase [Candidatus Omnitrophota bacterium]